MADTKKICILEGNRYGRLTVLSLERMDKKSKKAMWRCVCSCNSGRQVVVRADLLTSGKVISCGCYQKEMLSQRRHNLEGKIFGRLTVIKYAGVSTKNRSPLYQVKCECGTKKIVRGYNLTSNRTKSCGCKRSYKQKER